MLTTLRKNLFIFVIYSPQYNVWKCKNLNTEATDSFFLHTFLSENDKNKIVCFCFIDKTPYNRTSLFQKRYIVQENIKALMRVCI